MTRKDFVAIAKVLDASGADRALCERMADMLANTNPRFKREVFLRACGAEK